MNSNLRTVKTAAEVKAKVQELGATLSKKFQGSEPVCVCILNGSFMFYSDLIRSLDLDVTCEFLGVSSYKNSKVSSGEVEVTLDISTPLLDRDVILIEDIVDSGLTMNYIINMIKARNPRSVTVVTLLFKPDSLKIKCPLDLIGFEIPNDFVVGYGIDYAGHYRNLPYLAVLTER